MVVAPCGAGIRLGLQEGRPCNWTSTLSESFGVLQLHTLRHPARVLSFAISPDGKRIASGTLEYFIKIWDADKGSEVHNPGECTRWCDELQAFRRWLHSSFGVDLV